MTGTRRPIKQRIKDAISVDGAGCWRWRLYRTKEGYATMKARGAPALAHRVAYQEWRGEIPEGLEIDHLCRVRDCVNPDHLEAVTGQENRARTPRVGSPTHCPAGHLRTIANTYVARDGRRNCKDCAREASRRYREGRNTPRSVAT